MLRQRLRTFSGAFFFLFAFISSAIAYGEPASQAALQESIYRTRAFAEPLVAFGPTALPEDAALLSAVQRYDSLRQPDNFAPLTDFLVKYPESNWRIAILANEGLVNYREGYFDRAIESFTTVWNLGKDAQGIPQKSLVDRAVAELIRMRARLGHADELAQLLGETESRPISGQAGGLIEGAKEGLFEMRNNPGVAYLCGPMAVKSVLLALHPESPNTRLLDAFRSGPHGVNFSTVEKLALQVGLDYRKARIADPGENLPLPAVVHWRVNHYAAVVGFSDGRYEIKDPTFGQESLWITPKALAAESDGYYLVPAKANGLALARVSASEAKSIYGMGFTSSSDDGATTTNDANAGGCGNCCKSCTGMPVAGAKALLASLNLTDTPLSYTPPKGPEMNITVIYNHLDVTQPANFTYTSLSHQWSMNWIAFVQDTPTNASAAVTRVFGGGGSVIDSGCSAWNCQFTREALTGDILTRAQLANGSVVYTLTDRDGAQKIYAQSDGSSSGTRRTFLTEVRDPQGNSASLFYDAQMRLTTVADALGQTITFSYENSAYPYNVTKATDPFGRVVSFDYDSAGRLSAITDVIGLQSTFAYGNPAFANFVSSMTTPYGTSYYAYQSGTFAGGDGNQHPYRTLTLMDARGDTQKVEYYVGDGTHPNVPPSDPASQVPIGTSPALTNMYLLYRNTFYWNAEAYKQNSNDFSIAKAYHFLHDSNNLNRTSRALESVKQPLQNRVWYTYIGQTDSLRTGSLYRDPTDVAFVVNNNGSRASSVAHRIYNAQTNVTCYKDPVGRITQFDFAANGIDRLKVRTARSGATCGSSSGVYDVVGQYTYNGQHEPLTYTDAANQTTTYTYDTAGQLTSETNALGETTSYHRDANSYLIAVSGPHGEALAGFTYDAKGRMATKTDAGGETLAYTWDDLNRLTNVAYPDGTSRIYRYDRLDLAAATDRLNHTTNYGYDADRNQTSVTDPLSHQTIFSFDGNHQLVGMLDANDGSTTWQRDIQARPIAKIYPDSSSEGYVYTPEAGWLRTETDPLGQTAQYGYTTDGRVNAIDYLNAITPTPSVGFAYDPSYPRMTTMTDSTGTTTYGYYPVGSLGANRIQNVLTPRPLAQIGYSYDAVGRVAGRSIDGKMQSFGYDDLGRIRNEQNTLSNFAYTYLGATYQVTSVTPSDSPYRLTYDYLDNLNDRRLKTISNGSHGKSLQKFDYTTDAENQALSETAHDAEAVHYDYSYDADRRLTEADASGYGAPRKRGYTYDSLDNLEQIASTDHTQSVLYQANYNALNQVTQSNGTTFTYDSAGELTDDGARTYSWDAAHRLVSVTNNNSGALTSYTYDGLGRRVSITNQSPPNMVTTDYLWCANTLCQARDTNDVVLGEFFHQGEIQGASKLLYARDRLGSVTNLVDAPTGSIKSSFAYDPWGNLADSSGTLRSTFGFAGMFADQSTGKNLTLFRAYDPLTARWMSRDPMGLAAGLNDYTYVGANPVNFVDMYGLDESNTIVCGPNGTMHTRTNGSFSNTCGADTCLAAHEECHLKDFQKFKDAVDFCKIKSNEGKPVEISYDEKQQTELHCARGESKCLSGQGGTCKNALAPRIKIIDDQCDKCEKDKYQCRFE